MKDNDLGSFHLQLASGEAAGERSLLLTSKVIRDEFPDIVPKRSEIEDHVKSWVDDAHNITHQFFESFVTVDLMNKFKEKGTA